MMQAMEKAEVLIEALPYIQKFSDAIVVINSAAVRWRIPN